MLALFSVPYAREFGEGVGAFCWLEADFDSDGCAFVARVFADFWQRARERSMRRRMRLFIAITCLPGKCRGKLL
jgi:hypothetical protein